jgi:hypothetical protein
MNFNFGEVLTRSWNIIWKYKILWVFGLLASLGGSSGNGSGFRFNSQSNNGNQPFPFPGVERFFENLHLSPFVIFLLVLLALVLFIALLVLSTIGRASLIRGAWLADSGDTNIRFGRLWSEGLTYFWRLIILGVLILVLSLVLVMIIVIPTALASVATLGIALICLLPFICLLIPVFILLNVLVELANIAIVGEDLGVMDGLRRSWEVFRSHLGEIIGIGLIVIIAAAVIGFVFSLPLLVIMAPFIAAMFSQTTSLIQGGLIVSLVLFVLYLPILLAVHAVITSYTSTAWTVTFRRLTGRTAEDLNKPIIIDAPSTDPL